MTWMTSGDGDVRAKRGAMTMAMKAMEPMPSERGVRALRIARVRAGRIEEERIEREVLRVGGSERAEMPLPGVVLTELFRRHADGWTLQVPAGATDVRVAQAGATATLAPGGSLRLAPDARGRIRFGAVTFLFQLIDPPPVLPKPQLPASVRGGVFGQVDWAFTSISAAMFTFFFASLVFLEGADWPVALDSLQHAREVALLFEEPEPPPAAQQNWAEHEPEPELEQDVEPETETAPQPTTTNDRPSRRNDRPARNDDARPSLDPEAMAQQAAAMLIGALRSDDSGSAIDQLITGADTSMAGDIIAQAAGVSNQATARNDRLFDRDTRGSGDSSDLGMLARRQQPRTQMEGRGFSEMAPTGRVRTEDPIESGGRGVFDSRQLVSRIRGMSRRFARCYEGDLSRDATIAGRITFAIRVMEAGNVRASVRDNQVSPNVGRCITRHLNSIRFREGPEGGSVEFEYPFIFAPQR